jgi:CubicO group peptidase (beta-lactamase class C family)
MNRRRLLTTTIFCLAAQAAAAISAPLPTLVGRIDPIFAAYTAAAPGCAVGVEQAGKVLFAKGYGAADAEAARPLTPQSKVYMASVSKQVTAMAALLLVEDGRLRLNDPIRKYIPELPPYADGVTVAQLLNHTSGIRDYFVLGALSGQGETYVYTEQGVLDLLGRQQALDFPPGSEFLYSNSGYVLVSIIVQRVSGQKLDAFARARIFAPVGMAGSRFQHDHTAAIPDKANGYQRRGDQWVVSNSYLDVVGDGGLYSSVDDMLKWLANLDRPVVGAKALAVMRTSARLTDGSPSGYGMGLETSVYRGQELVQHGGALVGYRTADWWFPKQKLGVVVLCNRGDARTGELAGRVANLFLADEMKPATAHAAAPAAKPASGEDVSPYAGLYRDATGGYAEFVAYGGELAALQPYRATLASRADGQFVVGSDPDGARFVFSAGGALEMVRAGQPTRRLQRVERLELSDDAKAAYVGDYTSSEVSSPIHVRRTTGLALSVGDGPTAQAVATGPDRLWMPLSGAELVFSRDAAGKVTGFTLNAGRARGLKYARSGA